MTDESKTATAAVIPLQRGSIQRGKATFAEVAEAYLAWYEGPDDPSKPGRRGRRDPTRRQRVQFWVEQPVQRCVGKDADDQPMYKVDRIGNIPLGELDSDHMDEALAKLASEPARRFIGKDADGQPIYKTLGPRSGGTINRYAAACQAVLKFARKHRMLPKAWVSPFKEVEKAEESKGRERFLTDEEVTRLLAACRLSAWPKLRLLVMMAITTGARKGELLKLKYGDLDLTERTAILHDTKNAAPRKLPLAEGVVQELRRTGIGSAEKLIFPSGRKPNQPRIVDAAWRKVLDDAGLRKMWKRGMDTLPREPKPVVFHSTRHTAASAQARAGKSLHQIGELLGHKSPTVTKKYAHLVAGDKVAMVDEVWGALK